MDTAPCTPQGRPKTPRLTLRDWNSTPSSTPKRSRPSSPSVTPSSKRPRYYIPRLPLNTVPRYDDLQKLKEQCQSTEINKSTPNDLINIKLVSDIGFDNVVKLRFAVNHVPQNFPNRLRYISNIVFSDTSSTISDDTLGNYVKIMDEVKEQSYLYSNMLMDSMLWDTSIATSEPHLIFLAPGVSDCIHCGEGLTTLPEVTRVTVFTLRGPLPALRCTAKCRACHARYGIHQYSVPNGGWKYYPPHIPIQLKAASNKVFFDIDTYEFLCEAGNHAFVSWHSFVEIYNTVFHIEHPAVMKFQQWLNNSKSSHAFNDDLDSDIVFHASVSDEDGQHKAPTPAQLDHYASAQQSAETQLTSLEMKSCGCQITMNRKNAAQVFLNGELENEVRQRKLDVCVGHGPGEREKVMKLIDDLRQEEVYSHPPNMCSERCKKLGCENLRVADGCWKLCIPHCMLAVPTEVEGYPKLSFPNVCTEEPASCEVFCREHISLLRQHNIPTNKHQFLKFIGCVSNPSSSADIKKVDEKVTDLVCKLYRKDKSVLQTGTSAVHSQGANKLAQQFEKATFRADTGLCSKDTGEKARLRQRSRGHFVIVSGSLHIRYWNPIFKSESPCQAFMQFIHVMYLELKNTPEDKLEDAIANYTISYDNMCHVETLKAAAEDLPLPPPYNTMFKKCRKIIDRLHLRNHKNKRCQTMYNPDDVLPEGYNTMAGEQVFAWASRFKKIVNSMTQRHHMFYLHRMFQRRNTYTSLCRLRGLEPVLPGINLSLNYK